MIMMMIIAVNSQLNEMKAENERLQLELSETRKNPRPDNIPVPSPPSIPAAEDAVEVAKAKAEPKRKSRQIKVAFPYAMACKFLTAYVLSVHTCLKQVSSTEKEEVAESESADKKKQWSVSGLHRHLKNKPKKDLENLLTQMGTTSDDQGRAISSLTKADMINLLEQQLA